MRRPNVPDRDLTPEEQQRLWDWQASLRCRACGGSGGRRSGENCQGNTHWITCSRCGGSGKA